MHKEKEAGFFSLARWGLGGVLIVLLIIVVAVSIMVLSRFSVFSEISAAVLFFVLIIFVFIKKSERIVLPSDSP